MRKGILSVDIQAGRDLDMPVFKHSLFTDSGECVCFKGKQLTHICYCIPYQLLMKRI